MFRLERFMWFVVLVVFVVIVATGLAMLANFLYTLY